MLGGGVAANGALRARLADAADELGLPLVVPRPGLCTDNGAMIGAAGARRFAAGERAGLDLDARPSLPLARGPTARGAWRAEPWRAGPRLMTGSIRPRIDQADVRATLRAAGLRARHALSQNFLADVDVLEAILAEAAPEPGGRSSRSARASGS